MLSKHQLPLLQYWAYEQGLFVWDNDVRCVSTLKYWLVFLLYHNIKWGHSTNSTTTRLRGRIPNTQTEAQSTRTPEAPSVPADGPHLGEPTNTRARASKEPH